MGDENVLPANNDNDLENLFTHQNYLDVADDDATRVEQCATDEFTIFLFKDKNDNNTDDIAVTWNGQSDLAPSSSTVYLQVFNRTTTTWENEDSESVEGANTDFDLEGEITANHGDYYDASNWVAWRVYQEAA